MDGRSILHFFFLLYPRERGPNYTVIQQDFFVFLSFFNVAKRSVIIEMALFSRRLNFYC